MKIQWLRRSMCGALVALAWGCGAEDSGDSDLVRTITSKLVGDNGNFSQVLRVNPGETLVRNICELTVPLSGPKPLTFLASGLTGSPRVSVGWRGHAVSTPGLTVEGCSSYPCDVIARWKATASSGSALGCEIIADDGTTRLSGTSNGTALTVNGPPTTPVIFNQDTKIGPSGTPVASSCVLRQSAELPNARVTNFRVSVSSSTEEVNLLGPTLIGNVPWSTPGPAVPLGKIYVGSEPGATRLKHVIARKEQLAEGTSVRCGGEFDSQSGSRVFSVNTPVAGGISLVSGTSGWTCAATSFGSGDGCDCTCGIIDADCDVACSANESSQPVEADYCNLQFPPNLALAQNQPSGLIFGRLFEAGVTEAPGAPAGILAQVGWGPPNTNPATQSGWQFFPASYNVQLGNDDEFMGSFNAPPTGGSYRYTFRFSPDGHSWTYCDLDGAGSDVGLTFDTAQLGMLTVGCTTPPCVANETGLSQEADFCNLQWPPTLQSSGLIYGRLYEAGLTEAAGAPAGVIAEVGWGPPGVNPLTQSGWQFFPAFYNIQVGNDDEFTGAFNEPSLPGEYRYTFRFSLDGTWWTYCDLNGAGSNPSLDFDTAQLGTLTVP